MKSSASCHRLGGMLEARLICREVEARLRSATGRLAQMRCGPDFAQQGGDGSMVHTGLQVPVEEDTLDRRV